MQEIVGKASVQPYGAPCRDRVRDSVEYLLGTVARGFQQEACTAPGEVPTALADRVFPIDNLLIF